MGIDESPEPGAARCGWCTTPNTGATVRAVAVVDLPVTPAAFGAPVPLSDTGLEAHARSWPDQVPARLPAAGAPAVGAVEACTTQGDPSTVLLKMAAQPVLLGLGNTRRSALGSALVELVATRRVHRARCPVVLVPGSDASPRRRSP
ncbi:universal stress protein (plasmid) [Pseudonocardia bannensis]|uniref:universal stress protein n=1 Tax=Pseudonocardia bannensis TaxID=630973 RepID=UPI0028AB1641|nr:universal stress protein [Pseudonocardia bannensis]